MISFRLRAGTDPIFPFCPKTGMGDLQRWSLLDGAVVDLQS